MRWQLALMFRLANAKKKKEYFVTAFSFSRAHKKQTQSLIRETAQCSIHISVGCIGRISWMSMVISTHARVFYICASQIFAKIVLRVRLCLLRLAAIQSHSQRNEFCSAFFLFLSFLQQVERIEVSEEEENKTKDVYIYQEQNLSKLVREALRIRHAQKIYHAERNPNETRQRSHHGVECRMCMPRRICRTIAYDD